MSGELRADTVIGAQTAANLGLAAVNELLAAGVTYNQIRYRVRVGDLVPVFRGVVRSAAVPSSRHQRLMAIVLQTRRRCVLSHRTAAELLGLDGVPRGFVE